MKFDAEGHLDIRPVELLAMARTMPRRLVNDYLLVGTPRVFGTYDAFCRFRESLAEKLHVHPSAIVIRGSAKLGYSIAPRIDKAWQELTTGSDIDVAIADVDYFNRLDAEIRTWESRQRLPRYNEPAYKPYAKRQHYRSFNCVADSWLPRNTCVAHRDVMDGFDVAPYCTAQGGISAFVFRDWWSLRNRYEHDLRALCEAVDAGQIHPPDPDDEQ